MGNHGHRQCSPYVSSIEMAAFCAAHGKARAFSRRYEAIFVYFDNKLEKIVYIPDPPSVLLLDTIDAHIYP